jgi:hypothetical protein
MFIHCLAQETVSEASVRDGLQGLDTKHGNRHGMTKAQESARKPFRRRRGLEVFVAEGQWVTRATPYT